MMETMIPPQVGMRLRTKKIKKRKKRGHKKEKREKAQIKNEREKERTDNVTILLPHLRFKVAP